jgi:hypothetical protein
MNPYPNEMNPKMHFMYGIWFSGTLIENELFRTFIYSFLLSETSSFCFRTSPQFLQY